MRAGWPVSLERIPHVESTGEVVDYARQGPEDLAMVDVAVGVGVVVEGRKLWPRAHAFLVVRADLDDLALA
jgi:hypothetical protein